jgi:OmpA-OmpF porin, OOP family
MKALKAILVTFLLVLIATPAFAARHRPVMRSYDSSMMQPSFYIGVAGGMVSTDVPTLDAAAVSTPATNANSVFIGYEFNKYVAAELGYTAFNNLEVGADTVVKTTAPSLSVVGMLPMGQVADLFAKVGYASTSTIVSSGGVDGNAQTLGGATYGGGVQFNLGRHMNLRLAYDVYKITTDGTTNYTNNVSSLGVMVRF